jgi:hypothetical protein
MKVTAFIILILVTVVILYLIGKDFNKNFKSE